jgi:glycine/D-amino acid oxidase-like deaminating enzyme
VRRTAEVVVVGGGIIGTSVAYHLARRGCRDVVVLERELIGSGSTGKCNGGVRLQFSTPSSLQLSLEAVHSGVGFSFRKEGPGVLMGMTKPEPPGTFDDSVDWDWLPHVVEHAVRWLPALGEARIARGYAGLYDLSPDRHPIMGPIPEAEGLFCCTGFSGHGFMHGPPAGRHVAGWILDGKPSLDLSPFSIERFRAGAIVHEQMVW